MYSSVVAAWNADERDAGSNPLSILHVFLHFNLKDVGSNPPEQYVNNE